MQKTKLEDGRIQLQGRLKHVAVELDKYFAFGYMLVPETSATHNHHGTAHTCCIVQRPADYKQRIVARRKAGLA